MVRIFILIFIIIPNILLSQSQVLNGINLNGPEGFVKVDDLTWMKGNDLIGVFAVKETKDDMWSSEFWEKTCKNGTRTTEFHSLKDYELNGDNYSICYQIGENKMVIGQVLVWRGEYTYAINVGVSMLNYKEPNQFSKSLKEVEFNIGYMINRVLMF